MPRTHGRISPGQLAALRLAANGHTSRQIARQLGTTERGIHLRIHDAVAALGATSRTQAVAIALCLGLIRPDEVLIPDAARQRTRGAAA